MKAAIKFFISSLVLITCLWVTPCWAGEDDFLTQVARANDLYANKQYQDAVDIYEKLAHQGFENGYLYYNLGNAYFRLNNLGAAILNYSRAEKRIPRFEDLKANLRYAVQETPDKIFATQSSFPQNVIFWLDDFSPREYGHAILAVNALFWLVMIAWWHFRTSFLSLARNALLAVLLVVVVSAGARFYTSLQYHTGVILEKEVDVKSARGMDSVTLFQLHEGAIVNIQDEAEEWYKIELSDGKKGWAPGRFIGKS